MVVAEEVVQQVLGVQLMEMLQDVVVLVQEKVE
jgi:hypothetical protein